MTFPYLPRFLLQYFALGFDFILQEHSGTSLPITLDALNLTLHSAVSKCSLGHM